MHRRLSEGAGTQSGHELELQPGHEGLELLNLALKLVRLVREAMLMHGGPELLAGLVEVGTARFVVAPLDECQARLAHVCERIRHISTGWSGGDQPADAWVFIHADLHAFVTGFTSRLPQVTQLWFSVSGSQLEMCIDRLWTIVLLPVFQSFPQLPNRLHPVVMHAPVWHQNRHSICYMKVPMFGPIAAEKYGNIFQAYGT